MGHIFKLVGIKNAILDNIKLELPSNYLNELIKCVKKNNRSKGLKSIISKFLHGLGIIAEADSLKCLDQCYSNRYILVKERISISQILLTRISLKYYQVI